MHPQITARHRPSSAHTLQRTHQSSQHSYKHHQLQTICTALHSSTKVCTYASRGTRHIVASMCSPSSIPLEYSAGLELIQAWPGQHKRVRAWALMSLDCQQESFNRHAPEPAPLLHLLLHQCSTNIVTNTRSEAATCWTATAHHHRLAMAAGQLQLTSTPKIKLLPGQPPTTALPPAPKAKWWSSTNLSEQHPFNCLHNSHRLTRYQTYACAPASFCCSSTRTTAAPPMYSPTRGIASSACVNGSVEGVSTAAATVDPTTT